MIRIGIIGTGRIARRFIPESLCVDGVKVTAVYNPHEGSARKFVEDLCSENHVIALDSLDDVWDLVDAVYIASPHETHVGYIKEALTHGKHVLCEKPMALKKTDAKRCFRTADERNLVLMEAVKTAYCPGYKTLVEKAKSGIIGEIRYIDSCFTKLEDKNSRELNDTKYGGSFTELGSYVMLPIFDLLKDIEETIFTSIYSNKGIDIFTKVDIKGKNSLAQAECGLGVKSEGRLLIGGTKGFIKVNAPWWKTSQIEIHFENESESIYLEEPFEGDGLRYEIAEFVRRIDNEKCCALDISRKRSIHMAELMERKL